MLENYTIPLDWKHLTSKSGPLAKISLEDSVSQHIFLMLVSHFESYRFDPSFGCEFWEYDYEPSSVLDRKKHHFEESIRQMLIQHEPRLDKQELRVDFKMSQGPIPSHRKKAMQSLKKRISIQIRGRLLETDQVFAPDPFIVYFSPVSIGKK